ncbi:serine/arginine repetitive matrix protein 2-like [Gigantopelta aegis]|uniref:serine/arginine repetitive matrix protein 2-like n=1 Tax=Gigantopelta aegis TaxID=1735272 RepID=UPI001B889140|nr:serine/arginine repetitive matrix protein 2-like [Gigantopelta aegis]
MKKKSEVKKVSSDDVEDPELVALREAALLTKKKNANQNKLDDNNQCQNAPPSFPPPSYSVADRYGFPVYEQPVFPYSCPPPPPGYPPRLLYSQPHPPMLSAHNPVHPNMLPRQSVPVPVSVASFPGVVSHHSGSPLHPFPVTTHQSDVNSRGGSPFMQNADRKAGNNLIVITQAGEEETKKETGKTDGVPCVPETKPQLQRPQDKWQGQSDGKSSATSPVKRPKTSDKFSRFDSSNESEESESDSDDDDLLLKKNDNSISSDDDDNDSNKENSDNSSRSHSELSGYESGNEKDVPDEKTTASLNETTETKNDRIVKPRSKENIGDSSRETRPEKETASRNDRLKRDSSVSLQNESSRVRKLSNNHKRDAREKVNDRNSVTSSRDKVSDLSEKLKNRKVKMEKDLSEKLLNRKSNSEKDLSEKLLNRNVRKEGDLSERLSSRKDIGRKDVKDLSHKLSSRKNKSTNDRNKDISASEPFSVDTARLETERKLSINNSDVPQDASNDSSKIRMMEDELHKLEARRQKFQEQKTLDLMQVQKTISLKAIKKRKKKKVKSSRSRSRSLPRQYRHPPRSPSLPRQYRDVPLPKSRSPHRSARERSLSLPRQYRTELRDRIKRRSKERKGHDESRMETSHRNEDKKKIDRRGDVRRRLSGGGDKGRMLKDQSNTEKKDKSVAKSDNDEESASNASAISDVESDDDSEGRSWRTEANKNRVRRRSTRNISQIPNSLTISRPFGDRQPPRRNGLSPDRFRDRRKRRDRFNRDRFEVQPQRYDNFTVKRPKRFQSIESEEEKEDENGDKKISSSVVLPNRNVSSVPAVEEDVNTETNSFKKSKTKRTVLPETVLEVNTAKRKVVNSDGVHSKSRRVTADYDSEFDARNYLNSRSKVVDKNLEDKLVNDDSNDAMGVFVTLAGDGKELQPPRASVLNRLGSVSRKSEKHASRNTLKPVLKNSEERTVKRVKSKSKDDGLYEDDLEIKIRQIKEKNAAILRRQEEIRKDKERFGYK